jgi:hypothetical protein
VSTPHGWSRSEIGSFSSPRSTKAPAIPTDAVLKPDWKELRDGIGEANPEEVAKQFFQATQELTMALNKKNATVLIAVDQFEELLSPSAGQSAARFLRFLKAAFARKNGRLLPVGTLRSDCLGVYEKHPHAMKTPLIHPWRFGPFPRERIPDVIVNPADRAGIKIQPELLARLVKETPTAEALPLLAFTLEKLYHVPNQNLPVEVLSASVESTTSTYQERREPSEELANRC